MKKEIAPPELDIAAPPRRRGRPRAFDREAALGIATRLFWQKGYEATSILDLTAALNIAAPSLYAAFGSKDALYVEVLQHYYTTYESLVWGSFRTADTARAAATAYLSNSAAALTGALCDIPRGCMATLATVGSAGHEALGDLIRTNREGVFTLLINRFERAVDDGDLPPSVDIAKLARFLQTVQSGMSIRARDGADRAELQGVAEVAMLGWDGLVNGG